MSDGVPGTTTIRTAVAADADAIAAIRVAGWRTAYAGLIEDAVLAALDPVTEAARRRREWADRPPGTVAEVAGEVVGFVFSGVYRTAHDEPGWPVAPAAGEIQALYVHPAAQGRGAGRLLLAHALARLAADGLDPVRLWVLAGNTRARVFYAAAGFTSEGPLGVAKPYTPTGGTRGTLEVRYSRPRP